MRGCIEIFGDAWRRKAAAMSMSMSMYEYSTACSIQRSQAFGTRTRTCTYILAWTCTMETSCSASLGGLAHRWRVRGLARMCTKRPRPDSMSGSLSLAAGIKGSITPAFWLRLYGLLMFNSRFSFGLTLQLTELYSTVQCCTVRA